MKVLEFTVRTPNEVASAATKMIPPSSFTNEAREAMANAYNGFKKGK